MAEVITEIASFDVDTSRAQNQIDAYISKLNTLQKEQSDLQKAGKDTSKVNEEIAKTTAILNRALEQETKTLRGAEAQLNAYNKAQAGAAAATEKTERAAVAADKNVIRLARSFASGGASLKNLGSVAGLTLGNFANLAGLADLSGLALGALSSVAGKLVDAFFGLSEAEKAVQAATEGAITAFVEENAALTDNFNALLQANPGTQQRADLIEKINSEYGQYLPALLTEKSSLLDIALAYEAVNRGLAKKIANQSIQDQIQEQSAQLLREYALILKSSKEEETIFYDPAEAITGAKLRIKAIKENIAVIQQSAGEVETALLSAGLGADEFYKSLAQRGLADAVAFGLESIGVQLDKNDKAQKKATDGAKTQRQQVEALDGSLAALEARLASIGKQINEQTRIGDSARLEKLGAQYAQIAAQVETAKQEIERFKRGVQDVQEVAALPDLPPIELPVTFATTAEAGAELASQIEEALARERVPILEAALNAAEIARISAQSADAQAKADSEILRIKLQILEAQRAIAIADGESVLAIDKEIATLNAQRVEIDTSAAEANFERLKSKIDTIFSGVAELSNALFDFLAQSAAQSVARFDSAVQKQQTSLDALLADQQNASAQQVRIEQERLDRLTEERRKASEREKTIIQIQIAANAALAIAKAAAEGGGLASAITIAATLASLAFGFVAARQQSEQAFAEGTTYVTRAPGEKRGRDTVRAWLDEGEAVIPKDTNKRYHKAIEAIYAESIPAEALNAFVSGYESNALQLVPLPIATPAANPRRDRKQMQLLAQIATNTATHSTLNITERGLHKIVTTRETRTRSARQKYQ